MTSVHTAASSRKPECIRSRKPPLYVEALGFVSHLQYPLGEPDAGEPGSNVGLDQGGRGLSAFLVGPILARGLLLLQEATLRRRALRAEHPQALGRRLTPLPPGVRTTPGRLRFSSACATSPSSSSSLAANREASPRHPRQLTGIYRSPPPCIRSSSVVYRSTASRYAEYGRDRPRARSHENLTIVASYGTSRSSIVFLEIAWSADGYLQIPPPSRARGSEKSLGSDGLGEPEPPRRVGDGGIILVGISTNSPSTYERDFRISFVHDPLM